MTGAGYEVRAGQSLERLNAYLADHPRLRIRIVCPSQEFSPAEMALGTGRWFAGVRGIWESLSLGLERDVALVMIQAPPVPDEVMDYLFGITAKARSEPAGRAAFHADLIGRHAMVNIEDSRACHLSEKLLDKPAILSLLSIFIESSRRRGHVVQGLAGYASSERMAELADLLDVELLETPPTTLGLGTKAGSRLVFREVGVGHPAGTYEVERDVTRLAAQIVRLRDIHGGPAWMLKLNEGLGSGHGNAVIAPGSGSQQDVADALRSELRPACTDVPLAEYLRQLERGGAIVEECIQPVPGGEIRLPSALGYLGVAPDGSRYHEILGTHEQIVGPQGDFLGSTFPASPRYRAEVLRSTELIMANLAGRGVLGHVGVDFIARSARGASDGWTIFATEINLRQTGTTHPNRTVRALVDGEWLADGTLVDRSGREVVYRSTDALISDRFRGISVRRLIKAIKSEGEIGYDPALGRGVVPHLWTTLEPFGKVGATVIGHSAAECADQEQAFVALLDRLG